MPSYRGEVSVEAQDFEKERLLLGQFFNPQDLHPKNLERIVSALEQTSEFRLASAKEWLARFLMESYRQAEDKEIFLQNITEWAANNPQIDDQLGGEEIIGEKIKKRLPAPSESIRATVERLRIFERVKNELFTVGVEAVVLGGSLSYGPFYNIRERKDSQEGSDIDLLVIGAQDPENVDTEQFRAALLDIGASTGEVDHFIKDWLIFMNQEENFDLFSKKLNLAEGKCGFRISFHLFRKKAFTNKFLNLQQENQLTEFRVTPFPTIPHWQLNMRGQEKKVPVSQTNLPNGYFKVKISTGYRDEKGVFTPMVYHNLVLPNMDIFFNPHLDTAELQMATANFVKQIQSELEVFNVKDVHIRRKFISSFLQFHLGKI